MRNFPSSLVWAWKRSLHGIKSRRFVLLSIVFPLGLRTIPELLAGPWPLGFDTVWVYAPFVKDVEREGLGSAFASFFSLNHSAPLVYVLLGLGAVATGAPPFATTRRYAFCTFSRRNTSSISDRASALALSPRAASA